jgi:hypothetical protein
MMSSRAPGPPWSGSAVSLDQQACGESEPFATLAEAKQACHSLGSGWRLPTLGELLSIVDPCRRDPALAEPFVDTVKNTTDRGPSWTSTNYEATDSERAYAVDLSTGQVVLLKPQTLATVRCTRFVQAR